jgi:HEAT repeat protein
MSPEQTKMPRKTAAELLRQLEADPHFQTRARLREQAQRVDAARHAGVLKPVLDELAARGIWVTALEELVSRDADEYKEALPILIRWLGDTSSEALKEDIVRTLSTPRAQPLAGAVLIQEFRKARRDGLRWAIANALSVVADDRHFESIVGMIGDREYGKAREMLVIALARVRDPRADEVLMNLLTDEELVGHAVIALGERRSAEAKDRLERLTTHRKKWIRTEAKKALQMIRESVHLSSEPPSE